jgi:DNA-binding transcriptional LysR family regulator
MAQPNLTRLLHNLEEDLGFPLFDRSNKHRMALTPAGQTFLARITPMLEQYEEAVQIAQRISRGEVGKLVVGYATTAMLSILPVILHAYRQSYESELVMHDLSTRAYQTQLQALRKGQIDVAFLIRPEPVLGIAQEWVSRASLRVVLPASHALAKREAIPMAALAGETWVWYPRSSFPRLYDDAMALCQQAGFHPRIEHIVTQTQAIVNLVAAQAGISLVSQWSEQNLPHPSVVYRPLLDVTYQAELQVLWRKDDDSKLLQTFLQVVREVRERH